MQLPKLTKQQALLAALVLVFAAVYYFRNQIAVAVNDYAGKYWPLPPAGEPFAPAIQQGSSAQGVPFDLIARELQQESNFNPSAYNAGSGATGIAQFLPATAAQLGIDPTDPSQAIPGMAKYLMQINGYIDNAITPNVTWAMTLAGYNWGMGNVVKAVNAWGDQWAVHTPTETQNYIKDILGDVPLEPLPAGLA